ncbi:MAG: DUF4179 domain-containing protein [Clostridia bacterium]|nr:DUF4179 domain-containing protein [Clostridia bacterium]
MKSDQEIMQRIREAIDDCTREIDHAPSLQYQIARKARGEEPMVKKISASAVLVIALVIISMTAALAAGFGLFGELAQHQTTDQRLAQLDEVAEPMSVSLVTDDGISIEIGQAYYEGNRVFVSYHLSGNLYSVELHEGAPEEDYTWSDVLENTIASETFGSDIPELQRLYTWLNGEDQRWGTSHEASLHDGLFLEDGTYLDITDGSDVLQEDGSIIGWKECEIPADRVSDTLTFKAVLFRGNDIWFQDGTTCKRLYQRGENTDVLFTLNHNDHYAFLRGSGETDIYQAQAELASGRVDLKGIVHMTVPEKWVNIWNTWENDDELDIIEGWSLYQGGILISRDGTQSIRTEGTKDLYFKLLFPGLENHDGLSLVPEYFRSGEHMDEAISMEQTAE